MVKTNSFAQGQRCGEIGGGVHRRRVVLQPGETSGAVHPESTEESNFTHRRADISREARAGGQHQDHVAGAGMESRGDKDNGPNIGAAEDEPCQGVPEGRLPASGGDRGITAFPGFAAFGNQPASDARHSDFLARRRGSCRDK